jgi:hypothetical protein
MLMGLCGEFFWFVALGLYFYVVGELPCDGVVVSCKCTLSGEFEDIVG